MAASSESAALLIGPIRVLIVVVYNPQNTVHGAPARLTRLTRSTWGPGSWVLVLVEFKSTHARSRPPSNLDPPHLTPQTRQWGPVWTPS